MTIVELSPETVSPEAFSDLLFAVSLLWRSVEQLSARLEQIESADPVGV
jgi:hypothetical protein